MNGKLFIVGGGTHESADKIYGAFAKACGGENAKIVLVVTASGDEPDDTHRSYQDDFERLGVKRENVYLLPIYGAEFRDERGFNALNGDNECLFGMIEQASGIWFTGGDQYYTNRAFIRADGMPTRALEMFFELLERGGVVGGSSAGAAIMSSVMVAGGNNRGALCHDTVYGYDTYAEIEASSDPAVPLILADGLGFFGHGIVEQHFNKRPRLIRAIEACFENKSGCRICCAVSEDTAMVVQNDRFEVLGSAGVYVIDCSNAVRHEKGRYEGIILHCLNEGDSMELRCGEITLGGDCSQKCERHFARDYVSGAIIESPSFDVMINNNLLSADDECLYLCEKSGKRYVKGTAMYEAGGKSHLLVLKYFRDGSTKGYQNRSMSFVNVTLDINRVMLDL